jgi:hypothetical protein
MDMDFVRFSSGIETTNPNVDSALETVLEDLRKQIHESPKVEGGRTGTARRLLHVHQREGVSLGHPLATGGIYETGILGVGSCERG